MFAASLHLLLLVGIAGLASVAAFAWAFARGQLDDLDAQARSVLDDRDLRLDRPWESAADRAARERAHGPLVGGTPRDWGGTEDG